MKVVILQQDIAWADPAENVRQAEAAIDRRPGADLYVLPDGNNRPLMITGILIGTLVF